MCITESVGANGQNNRCDVKAVQILLNIYCDVLGLPAPLAEDGSMGPNTLAAIEAFQCQVVGIAHPDQRVDPGGATLAKLHAGLEGGLNAAKLKGIMINATEVSMSKYAAVLLAKLPEHDISTPLRQAHFLAQVGHESGELRYNEEIASGAAYEGRRDLGNTQPGDGPRFKGRGLIQLTGCANYQQYGQAIGRDLLMNEQWKQVADDTNLAVDVACWYWETRTLNQFADQDDITTITHRINGGLSGLDDRKRLLRRAKFFLGLYLNRVELTDQAGYNGAGIGSVMLGIAGQRADSMVRPLVGTMDWASASSAKSPNPHHFTFLPVSLQFSQALVT
jgi:putative chitinase